MEMTPRLIYPASVFLLNASNEEQAQVLHHPANGTSYKRMLETLIVLHGVQKDILVVSK